ncbi:MAG: amino acid adenylation domain-containing protein, partial [Actinomycetota bacterium]|nr:amino acid adenylation domain-containing protein [Actinomycetota bacterium]
MSGGLPLDAAGLLLRGERACPPRTLIDILYATVQSQPDADAIDNGSARLSYAELWRVMSAMSGRLVAAGVRSGDRVGVRLPSGTLELYVSILAVMAAGASYVPVDAEDPAERAELVFGEAGVRLVLDAQSALLTEPNSTRPNSTEPNSSRPNPTGPDPTGPNSIGPDSIRPNPTGPDPTGSRQRLDPIATAPGTDDDAWVIFTSGSTGTPKGVAISQRSAAAFVDAEARLFLTADPIGPGDRVLAGLSVAFDASCEEMWLAWRHGACLVPAPRSLVRSGVDLGPFLVHQRITVVSTVPTLASLWQPESLDKVRLIILGGEACPAELADRLVGDEREAWNTYGPTEATVVACAAQLGEDGPVRIGLPLDGWDLAVVNPYGQPVGPGETGELIIGGVGLARYLDPAKDAEKFAPMATLGWERAYRSGDLVCFDGTGLIFVGRSDEQVKLGGRRIELGEVDSALQALPGVAGAAAAVRRTGAGNQVLVGYLVPVTGLELDQAAALRQLRAVLPAALVPMLASIAELPTRTSGKVDRAALPWPLPAADTSSPVSHQLTGTAGWLAELWAGVLGANVTGPDDDFFAHGGGSLAAAQLVSQLRTRFPEATVAQLYDHPRLGDQAALWGEVATTTTTTPEQPVRPVPRLAQAVQLAVTLVVNSIAGLRWLTMLAVLNNLLAERHRLPWAPTLSWWWVLAGIVLFISPVGRMGLAAAGARLLLAGVGPGSYPRGGSVHLRLWSAERLAEAVDAANLAGAPWIAYYARALGAKIGPGVTLHTLPPITGMLTLGRDCSVEPEVDLAGYWIDGDRLLLGEIRIGAGATVGSRSTCTPGADIGKRAEIAAGSAVSGRVPDGERWAGSPAVRVGRARAGWPAQRPANKPWWV